MDKQTKQDRALTITYFRAIIEALPTFREKLLEILNRQGANLPEWLL